MARSNPLTLDAVGKMTTYELRLEADSRGLLEELRPVNHQTLLKRIVQVIVEEEYERGRQCSKGAAGRVRSAVEKEERIRRERSERKAAAQERSKQRQADHSYFSAKKFLNVQHEEQLGVDTSSPSTEIEEDLGVSPINPRRHKVFVR
ncbi:unnamed protein product [Scytosiphon promiscuus]